MVLPFMVPLVVSMASGLIVKTTVESGTWDTVGEKLQDIGEGTIIPDIPDPTAGPRALVDKMAMFVIISTVSIIAVAVTFTILYPKWKK